MFKQWTIQPLCGSYSRILLFCAFCAQHWLRALRKNRTSFCWYETGERQISLIITFRISLDEWFQRKKKRKSRLNLSNFLFYSIFILDIAHISMSLVHRMSLKKKQQRQKYIHGDVSLNSREYEYAGICSRNGELDNLTVLRCGTCTWFATTPNVISATKQFYACIRFSVSFPDLHYASPVLWHCHIYEVTNSRYVYITSQLYIRYVTPSFITCAILAPVKNFSSHISISLKH